MTEFWPRCRAAAFAAIALVSACATGAAPTAHSDQRTARDIPVGDAAQGRTYAAEVCSTCHAVFAGYGYSPNPAAPPFRDIARMPGLNSRALSAWLNGSHPSMPNFLVDQAKADDLYAYLTVLKQNPTGR